MLDVSVERSVVGCIIKFDEVSVKEYFISNVVFFKWMIVNDYGEVCIFERRIFAM